MTIIHHKGMRYKLQNELFAHQGICRVLQIVSKLTVPRGYVVFYKLLANSPLLLL